MAAEIPIMPAGLEGRRSIDRDLAPGSDWGGILHNVCCLIGGKDISPIMSKQSIRNHGKGTDGGAASMSI
jgi:hypothetical protein